MLRGCELADGQLTIDVDVNLAGPDQGADLVLAWSKGAATRRFPESIERSDGTARLRAVVTAAGLTAVAKVAAEAAAEAAASEPRPPGRPGRPGPGQAGDSVQWDLYVQPGQHRLAVAFPAGLAEFRYPSGERELAVSEP